MHVTGGVIYLICVYFEGKSGRYDGGRFERVEVAGLYWHFVDIVWIVIFGVVYLIGAYGSEGRALEDAHHAGRLIGLV
mgnify:CR=1 FL=1